MLQVVQRALHYYYRYPIWQAYTHWGPYSAYSVTNNTRSMLNRGLDLYDSKSTSARAVSKDIQYQVIVSSEMQSDLKSP